MFISSIYCFSAVKITLGQISRTNRIMGQFSSNNSYFSLAMISLDNLSEIQKSNKISIYDKFGSGSVKSAGSVVRPNLAEPPSSAELPNRNEPFGRSLPLT